MFNFMRTHRLVITGDLLVLFGVTMAGFATHGSLGTAGTRILATFLPLTAAWVLIGSQVGVFEAAYVDSPTQLWRPVLTMALGAPLFGLFRAWMLGTPTITVIFIMVIGGVGALAMFIWRGIYALYLSRAVTQRKPNG